MCFSHCADVFEAWAAALASPNAALRWFGRGLHAVWRMAKWRFRHCFRRNGRRSECYWWLMHVFLFPAQWYCMVKLKVKNGLNLMSSERLRDVFGMSSECLRNAFGMSSKCLRMPSGCFRDAFGIALWYCFREFEKAHSFLRFSHDILNATIWPLWFWIELPFADSVTFYL